MYWFSSMFDRFPAKLGNTTPPDGPGSKNGAESIVNQAQRPILMPFRDLFSARPQTLKSNIRSRVRPRT